MIETIYSVSVEVHRGKLETPVLLPPKISRVSDIMPRPAKAEKAGKPGREKRGKKKLNGATNQETGSA